MKISCFNPTLLNSSRDPNVAQRSPNPLPSEQDRLIGETGLIRDRTLFEEFIFVSIGPEKTKFDVHKGPLCYYSSYFKAALKGGFKESRERVVVLKDETEETFKLFYLWLYSQKILVPVSTTLKDWQQLVKLFVFADKRGIPKLRNNVIDAMVERDIRLRVDPIALNVYVYDNTPSSSPLRKLLVDIVAWNTNVHGLQFVALLYRMYRGDLDSGSYLPSSQPREMS